MIKEKIELSINEIPWENEKKNNYIDDSESLINETISKKGKAKKVVVNLNEGLSLVKEHETVSNPKAKAEERVRVTNLSADNKKYLYEKIKSGQINNSHITDIIKSEVNDALSEIPADAQKNVIDSIIANRNEKHSINSETVASAAIKHGKIKDMYISIWYRGFIRAVNQLIDRSVVSYKAISYLSEQQKNHLRNITTNAIIQLERFLKTL